MPANCSDIQSSLSLSLNFDLETANRILPRNLYRIFNGLIRTSKYSIIHSELISPLL